MFFKKEKMTLGVIWRIGYRVVREETERPTRACQRLQTGDVGSQPRSAAVEMESCAGFRLFCS